MDIITKNNFLLNATEMELVQNAEVLLTKQIIMDKAAQLLAQLQESIHKSSFHQDFPFPTGTLNKRAKISKGEKYQLLPYLVLDFPRAFSHASTFSFRSLFWWGNAFSFTLHLGGESLQQYQANILAQLTKLPPDTYCCVADTPWEYHYQPTNYQLLQELNTAQITTHLEKYRFLKLSRKLPLSEWAKVVEYGQETYELLLGVLLDEKKGKYL